MIPHISHQSLRLNTRVRNGNSEYLILVFTHNLIVGGNVGAAEAGDVGLAGLDVDLVLVLVPWDNLPILGTCLLPFLPETLKHLFFIIKRKKKLC